MDGPTWTEAVFGPGTLTIDRRPKPAKFETDKSKERLPLIARSR